MPRVHRCQRSARKVRSRSINQHNRSRQLTFNRSREACFLNENRLRRSLLLSLRAKLPSLAQAIMRNFFLFAVIVTSLLINSSASNRRLGIVGGRSSTIEKTPYQAAYCTDGVLKCGACIIDKEWALTAGMNKTSFN